MQQEHTIDDYFQKKKFFFRICLLFSLLNLIPTETEYTPSNVINDANQLLNIGQILDKYSKTLHIYIMLFEIELIVIIYLINT